MAEVTLIVQGGERITVEADYGEISSWFSQMANRVEVKQLQTRHTYKGDPMISIASPHIVAVIGKNGD